MKKEIWRKYSVVFLSNIFQKKGISQILYISGGIYSLPNDRFEKLFMAILFALKVFTRNLICHYYVEGLYFQIKQEIWRKYSVVFLSSIFQKKSYLMDPVLENPKKNLSFRISILWSIVSKAFKWYKRTKNTLRHYPKTVLFPPILRRAFWILVSFCRSVLTLIWSEKPLCIAYYNCAQK